ncbi:MAG: hypothetical protein GY940_20050 [bacterium]|nr:hypothetical protein [bacterium]
MELARTHNLSQKQIREMKEKVEENRDAIASAWQKHFGN